MNNSFKMNTPKSRLSMQSPYQRPISGGALQSNMYNPSQSESAMGNRFAVGYPGSEIRLPQREQMVPTNSFYSNSPATPRPIGGILMRNEFSPHRYPYFQNIPDPAPFPSERQSYSPFATQGFNLYPETSNTFVNSFEDDFSKRESRHQHSQINEEYKPAQSTTLSKKAKQRPRFEFTTKNKMEAVNNANNTSQKTDSMKTPKRRQDTSTPSMRILAGSIDKIIKWEKLRETFDILFEVIATLVAVRPGGHRCARMLLLRDQASPALQCVFHEIDRPLPALEKGQLVRCLGKMVSKNKLVAYSVRAVSPAEKSLLQRLSFASQRAAAAMELATPEP